MFGRVSMVVRCGWVVVRHWLGVEWTHQVTSPFICYPQARFFDSKATNGIFLDTATMQILEDYFHWSFLGVGVKSKVERRMPLGCLYWQGVCSGSVSMIVGCGWVVVSRWLGVDWIHPNSFSLSMPSPRMIC